MTSVTPSSPAPSASTPPVRPWSGVGSLCIANRRRWRWMIAGLLILGAVLRFWALADNPPWYTDELIYAAATRSVAEGESRFGAVRYPFARECLAKPPLWFLLAAPFQFLPCDEMVRARIPSALISLALVLALFRIGCRLHSPEAGLIAAWISLTHPPAMLFFRWGMPYNLAGLLNALTVLFLAEGWIANRDRHSAATESAVTGGDSGAVPPPSWVSGNRPLYWAAALTGLGAVTDFFSLQAVPLLIVWTFVVRRFRALPGMIALVAAPTLIFLVWGISVRGEFFLREWAALFFQMQEQGSLFAKLAMALQAAWATLTHDSIYLVGIVGLAAWAWKGRGLPVALFLAFMLPLILLRQGTDRSIPHNMTAYSFAFHLGFAVFLCEAAGKIGEWTMGKRGAHSVRSRRLGWSIALLPPVLMTAVALSFLWTGVPMEAKGLGSVRSVDDTRAVCDLLNAELSDDDVAIVPERLVVFLNCRAAPLNQAMFDAGIDATWMRYVRREELAFRPTLERARVVVLDSFDAINGIRPRDPNSNHPATQFLRRYPWRYRLVGEYLILSPIGPREGPNENGDL